MTITEANAVNQILRAAVMPNRGLLSVPAVREAAVLLADKAHKALGAGLRGEDVFDRASSYGIQVVDR